MFTIYSCLQPKIPVIDNSLFENRTYFIILDSPDSQDIVILFKQSSLKKHISWYPGNKIAKLCIKNFLGIIRIFDREFDIRSEKFDSSLKGTEQLKLIIDDLENLTKRISFSYDSSIYNRCINDWDSVENDYIHKFNYLYQVFFDVNRFDQAGYQIEKIKRNSSQKHDSLLISKSVWKLKKLTPNITKQLAMNGFSSGRKKFNTKVFSDELVLSNNTPENQFVRFFYEYCQQLCLKVLTTPKLASEIMYRAQKLLNEIRRILADPFFSSVDRPSRISTNSTILTSRDGYDLLMKYFINSLFSVKHIYEDLESQLKADLVDIATLYEIWCFYKLAFQLLGEKVLVSEKSSKMEEGTIKYSTTFENTNYKISYNKSFSFASKGSYSTTLRPDITVQKKSSNELYHFDAKYKLSSYINSDDVVHKNVKNEDLNKMHAYLDSIYNSNSSIVLYPGTSFKFFVRSDTGKMVMDLEEDFILKGIGALPLIPGNENLNFNKFFELFF
jgi:predicted component of viral defense system (DUF524 family)